jgi:hypothetical protein
MKDEFVGYRWPCAEFVAFGQELAAAWHDEFDGDTLDRSKWSFRLHLMQQRHHTFTDEGATLDGQGDLVLNAAMPDSFVVDYVRVFDQIP